MKRLLCCAVALLVLLAGCAPAPGVSATPRASASPVVPSAPTASPASAETPLYLDPSRSAAERAQDLLGRLMLRQKAAQMVQGERLHASKDNVTRTGVGSLLSGGGSVPSDNSAKGWRAMIDGFQQAALAAEVGIPLLYGIDAVHGHNNARGATIFPHNIGLGATNAPELMDDMGRAVAEELLATGIPWTFSPCVAVAQDPRWGRTYESFSDDPALVSALAVPYAQGLMERGVIPTAKHFLADGGTAPGSSQVPGFSLDQGDAPIDDATLRAVHLPPYQALVQAGVPTVMASFSSVRGVKMHASQALLTGLLKQELGFSGFVVSDWNGVQQLPAVGYEAQIAMAVNAGVDMLMEPERWQQAIEAIVAGVEGGAISAQRVDDAVARILTVKFQYGLFEDPLLEGKRLGEGALGSAEHRALAEELAGRSLVLLHNDGILPLQRGSRVLMMGPGADNLGAQCGGWTLTWQGSDGKLDTVGTTILEGMRQQAEAAGCTVMTDTNQASDADVIVLVVGERPYAEGQGDSADLSLTGSRALAGNAEAMRLARESGKPVVTVLLAGRQLMIADELPGWNAVVMAWLPGSEGVAVARALFGQRPFTGKLPMPWYASVEDIGKSGVQPLFPRGHGLMAK